MKYTDEQIRAMLKDAALWLNQLRSAAKQRKLGPFTSLSPIADVLAALLAHLQ